MTDLNPRVPGGEMAERVVCGAAMYLSPSEVMEVAHVVEQGDFLDPALGAFWNLEVQMAQAGKEVLPTTMIYAAWKTGLIEDVDEVEITALHGEGWLYASLDAAKANAGIVHSQGVKMQEIKNLQEMVREQVKAPKKSWRERYETSV